MSAIHEIEVTNIDGQPQRLSDYEGKVLLIVNVASKCGLTPQYEQLEKLYEAQRDAGLEVLGFPTNEFAGQEPGSEDEIKSFCQMNFGVQFPMFCKIHVNGDERHPLYRALIAEQPRAQVQPDSPLRTKLAEAGLLKGDESDVMWNFEKFLVSRDGRVVGRFAPDITVDNPLLGDAISDQLNG